MRLNIEKTKGKFISINEIYVLNYDNDICLLTQYFAPNSSERRVGCKRNTHDTKYMLMIFDLNSDAYGKVTYEK